MKSVTPYLTFQGNAKEAMAFYTRVFDDAELRFLQEYDESVPEMAGKVMQGVIRIHDLLLMVTDSKVPAEFAFSPSMSFLIECQSLQEIEKYYLKLKKKGAIHVPLDEYGAADRFAWVQDKFGVTWQLNFMK
ncbi:VOC family protein [Salinicoccus albus]|uniref:VOC family protein n=1 Tax=Salinicoccus albus TaxID=418756 RepID=UPI00037DF9BF|nr:VOC family protein [Salinicoccus albus]